ncbi:ATPase component of ABC transporters with duplicated ATPase domain [Saprospira grandis DSM 2844]|uniref:ATPase component of ABC transporters with duplicated ATPase domain n=1 Tax=Saprospira grandis DSM 2844 TaxID=694433 RepID=J0P3V5_9BACT|nr:ABC-F family ATP-binding cassette domain-containing protein [Saprospira grandis]EJF54529.1 ATPase component of ABC transporters with duplicated ATPase domain [Saprospira grandis DSM 2844]
MNYLSVEGLNKAYGDRVLFTDITFYINQGDKVALVAKNGTGKTSLLRTLAGEESTEGGKVWLHPNIQTVFLKQEPNMSPLLTVFEAVYQSANPIMQALANYEKAMKHPEDGDRLQNALSDMDRLNAWNYDQKVKMILSVLKVDYLDRPLGQLSGGQKKRVALAKVLIDEPDFLILDEPTNHLDLEMIEWLQDYLKQAKITLLTVTHDRYFLDAVCNQILELDQQELFKYSGNYSQFLEKKALRQANEAANLARTKKLYKKELEWMRRQPQARGTKAKSRVDDFYQIEAKAKKKTDEGELDLDIQMSRLGSKILELHNVSKSYRGQVLFEKLDYKFRKRDRLGIIGRNGTGKSTLLNIITQNLASDTGKVVHGETLKIGYYTQANMQIKNDKKALDLVRDIADYIPMNGGKKLSASQLMERFLFDPSKQQTFISKLSGGELRRLHLLCILMDNPNFLILDEPTNDLDIVSLQVLEEFLQEFPGCVLLVSHDRYFMDRIVEHVFVLGEDSRVRDFPGNYTDYRLAQAEAKKAEQLQKEAEKKAEKQKVEVKKSRPPSKEERKEIKKLERQIEKLEEKKQKLSAGFNDSSLSAEQIVDLSKELNAIQEELDEKEMQWMELVEELS